MPCWMAALVVQEVETAHDDAVDDLEEVGVSRALADQRRHDGTLHEQQRGRERRVGQEHGTAAHRQRAIVEDGGTVGLVGGQRRHLVLDGERGVAESLPEIALRVLPEDLCERKEERLQIG